MVNSSQINSQRMKALCKVSLSAFIQKAFQEVGNGEYHHNWHVDAIAEYLTACKERQIQKLIINMPPRSLKSIAVTVAFPAWLLGHDPKLEIMAASYSQFLSEDHSVDCRRILQADWYKELFPGTVLAKDQNQKSKFSTTAGGARRATSVTGSSTGTGANFLILDDPLNPKQAASDIEREGALKFITSTWGSRVNDRERDVSILVMQRLHENDPTGYLLSKGGWEHLCLPAINDQKRTITIGNFHKEWNEGALLDEKRLSEKILEQIKKEEMSSYEFAGQYLQRPSPEGGGIIKENWWQLWEGKEPPKTHDIIQVYDTAFTEKTSNDYSARTTWGIFEADDGEMNIILLERMNKRMEFPELLSEAKEAYSKYTKHKTGEPPLVLIEEKASGLPLIQELRKTGLRVKGIKRNAHSGDKISRCHNVTHIFENGRVWVPCNMIEVDGKKHYTPKPFAKEVIDSCSVFPNGAHDDLVDTVVDAVAYLRKWREIRTDYDKEDEPEYDNSSGKKKRYY